MICGWVGGWGYGWVGGWVGGLVRTDTFACALIFLKAKRVSFTPFRSTCFPVKDLRQAFSAVSISSARFSACAFLVDSLSAFNVISNSFCSVYAATRLLNTFLTISKLARRTLPMMTWDLVAAFGVGGWVGGWVGKDESGQHQQ